MKNKIILIVLIMSTVVLGSCKKFLDQIPDNVLREDDIFKSLVNTNAYLAQIYTNIPDEFNSRFAPSSYAGPWTGASDEANYWSLSWVMSNNLNQSTWDNNAGGTYWVNWYKPVRTATDFISKIDNANPDEVSALLRMHYKGEARALRAIFYYWMMRLYGPVIILPDVVPVNGTGDEIFFPRTSFDSCVLYVANQLDTAYSEIKQSVAGSPQLPELPLNNEWGRITTGVCKAYKFQTLMLAASPLFNGNKELASLKNKDGLQLINQTYDPNKWKLAVQAGKEFLDEFVPNTYELYTESDADPFVAAYKSCKNVVINDWNKEWIWGKAMCDNVGTYQYDITPKLVGYASSVTKGAGFLSVNQSMVDAYFMKNGYSITNSNSGYQSSGFSDFKSPYDVRERSTFNQWVNREARFYVGVTYNRSYWQNQGQSAEEVIPVFELSGNSGRTQSTWDVTSTGYIVRKQLSNDGSRRGWCYLRLAQMYLDYAEVLNETDPGNPDILKYVNLIRRRAGIAVYGSGADEIPAPTSQTAVRDVIRHERMVELAFENVRYFDVRRWKIAPQTMGQDVYGMNTYADGDDFYEKTLVEKRRFLQRDYLWPIPNDEILKDQYLVQNPGW
ncbi:MAG: RagB/SusD family nutrient uptake outer membrane protein [Ilyomonas sp.]